MSLYVDIAKIPYRGMLMCHMYADSRAELHDAAIKIGAPKWAYKRGVAFPRYDISLTQRARAIRLGAIAVDQQWIRQRIDTFLAAKPDRRRCA